MKKNRFIGILLFMFITSIAKAAEYELKAANVSAAQDGTATLAIELKNAGKIRYNICRSVNFYIRNRKPRLVHCKTLS